MLGVAVCFAQGPSAEPPKPAAQAEPQRRADLNLLGQTDTSSGESRRNENVQFNLIDNNALKDLNIRLGTTATLFEEFRADRVYFGSEFGNRPSSSIHLSAGRNSPLHGNLFASHGNSVLNARSFFTVGNLKPAHENQYGFSMGFQPWKKASLTLDGSQQKIRGNVNGNVLVPTAADRTIRATDPEARRLLQRFLDAFPAELPNRTDINERALNTNAPQSINDNSGGVRLDQGIDERNRFAARYQFTSQFVDAFQLVAGQNPDTRTKAHTAQYTWIRTMAPATTATATAMFDRVTSDLVPEPNAVGPQVNFSNVIQTLGPSSSIPIHRATNRFRYGAAVASKRGTHSWYAGADLVRRQLNGFEASSHRGNLYFRNDFGRTAMENFLLGVPSRYSGAAGNAHRGYRSWESAFHIGDSWRVNSSLQIHYGLRYELLTTPVEVNHFDRIPYDCDCNNFAPRFGLAYRLPRGGGMLRVSYGIHYGEIFPVTYSQMRYNLPNNRKFEIQAPDLFVAYRQTNVPVVAGERSTFLDISPELSTPYSHLYNLTWEPLPSRKWKLQFGYVGSRSHKLLMLFYNNRARPVPGIPQTTATINDRRPDTRYFDYRLIVNGSHAYFDAGRATLILPRWRGFSVDASYWISKAIDLGGAYTNTGTGDDGKQAQAQSESNVWADVKGPSSFDQKHAFLLRAAFATPRIGTGWMARWVGQWEISAVALLKTGTPFSLLTGSDGPGFGNVDGDNGDRPNLLDPSVLGRTINHPDTSRAMLPRAAFGFIGPTESRGNLGYNTFRKDGVTNLNASVSRSFSVGGDRKLTLRGEAINLTNTPQFAEPWREVSSPSFGFITNTLNDGRAIRVNLRFTF